ncbi:unnamed protein product [Cyclocybe aegerita]|uniref:Uncharacterized protein n=1 Tax=Cyclocybe aegerita TaxID=1973307 RepID=A0A8S0XIK9_CYCAE|nr:unnamed protein product [Cyclocybe aegerita]
MPLACVSLWVDDFRVFLQFPPFMMTRTVGRCQTSLQTRQIMWNLPSRVRSCRQFTLIPNFYAPGHKPPSIGANASPNPLRTLQPPWYKYQVIEAQLHRPRSNLCIAMHPEDAKREDNVKIGQNRLEPSRPWLLFCATLFGWGHSIAVCFRLTPTPHRHGYPRVMPPTLSPSPMCLLASYLGHEEFKRRHSPASQALQVRTTEEETTEDRPEKKVKQQQLTVDLTMSDEDCLQKAKDMLLLSKQAIPLPAPTPSLLSVKKKPARLVSCLTSGIVPPNSFSGAGLQHSLLLKGVW